MMTNAIEYPFLLGIVLLYFLNCFSFLFMDSFIDLS